MKYSCSAAAAAATSLQSCPTLCDPIDGSPPGSAIPGILQARTLDWVAISFSNAWKWKVKVKSLGCVRLFTTPWTAAHQAPPSMGFSRQEDWSGAPSPSPTVALQSCVKYCGAAGWFSYASIFFSTAVCHGVFHTIPVLWGPCSSPILHVNAHLR